MKNLLHLLYLCLPFLISAQTSGLNNTIPVNDKVTVGQLDNGLTYYIRPNAKPENKIELRLVVNAGSILETEKQRGLAHFMEHMNFNGTKNFAHNELVDYLQSIGVKFGQHLNAYTSFDETVYILPIPSEDPKKVERGFDILEDWAFNCLLTPEEIEKERGVVLEELRLGLGAEKRMMDNYLPKLMYGSQYAERLPIGLKSVLENFDHKELTDFYTSWYRPNLMAVIVIGDITVEEAKKKIEAHFGSYSNPKKEKKRKEFYVPDHKQTFVSIEKDKEASFTRVQLVYKDHGNSSPVKTIADYKDDQITSLFNTMLNNRLKEITNGSNPPFTYAYAMHGSSWSRNKTSFQSMAMTNPNGQLRGLKVLAEENERVKRHGFTQGELDRAKKEILSRYESSLLNKDKMESRRLTYELVNNFLEGEIIPGIEWEYNTTKTLFNEINLDDVNGLINGFIHDDNRVVILTGPETDESPDITEADVLAVFESLKNKEITPYDDGNIADGLMTSSPTPGAITTTETIEELQTTKIVLDNGVTVFYKKTDFKDNEIIMSAYSPGGSSLIETEDYLQVAMAMDGLTEAGVGGLSKNDLSKVLTGKQVRVSPYISGYAEEMRGSCVNADVTEMFQLIHLYFTDLNFNEDAYTGYVSKQVAMMGNILNTPQYWYMIEKIKVQNEKNPRYSNPIPTLEEFEAQDYQMAYDYYKERFADASDFTFIFVGSIDEEQIVELSKTYLGSLPSLNRNETYKEYHFERLKGENIFVFNKGSDPKSMVDIQYRTEAKYNAQDAYYLKSAGEILSIKLTENLREGESGVYGVGARGNAIRLPSGVYYFTISFPCGPENVEKLTSAARNELNSLLVDGPKSKDLDKIKEAQRLEYLENLKKNRYWVNMLRKMVMYNTKPSEMLNVEEKIEKLTADDIQNTLNKYITTDVIITTLMPEGK